MRFAFPLALLAFWLPQTVFSQRTPAAKPADAQKIVTGTVLLNDRTALDAKVLIAALRTDWALRIDSLRTGDKTIVFVAPGGYTVMIAWLDYPAAPAEIKSAAELSMLWPGAAQEAGRHQAQAVVSVIGTASRTVELYKLFTRVAAGLLDNTRSSGIYLGGQFLLLPKGYFLESARNMADQNLPLTCWVYFGLLQKDGINSGYTYGMHEFGLPEFEVINSAHSLQDVYALLIDVAGYAIRTNTRFTEGQAFTSPNGQKIPVQVSPSVYLKNETTVKLKF